MKKSLKIIVALLIVAVAAVAVYFVFIRNHSENGDAPAWQTAKVKKGDISFKVTASGTLSPLVTVEVGSQVSGRLQEILVDFNSEVKKGQVIARIDPKIIEFEVAKARANRQTAVAAIARAEASLSDKKQISERTAALRDQKLASAMDADSARAGYKSALAELASARASLVQANAVVKQAETNLTYTTIVSPIDGVVISRKMDVGQTVAASFQAPVLFSIAEDLRRMEVHTSLAESDVGQVKAGMVVEFAVDAFPSQVFKGTVKQVRYSPTTVQNVVTYDAVVSVENPELSLRPGMTADVSFIVAQAADALLVPNTAFRFSPAKALELKNKGKNAEAKKPAGGGLFNFDRHGPPPSGKAEVDPDAGKRKSPTSGGIQTVWVVGPDGAPVKVEVSTGITDGRNSELLNGLKEGDEVIISAATSADGPSKRPGAGAKP